MKPGHLILFVLILFNSIIIAQEKDLSEKILNDKRFDFINEKGLALLSTGFNAGTGYQEVWIRDFNTFIVYSLQALPEEEVMRQATRIQVAEALGTLPIDYQTALVTRYADECSVDEVARLLGRTYKATESLLSRARSAFQRAMAHLEEEHSE